MDRSKELIALYGVNEANNICDCFLTEYQNPWNQDKIDFYLDVKNAIKELV